MLQVSDALSFLRKFDTDIDLLCSSPPYADRRSRYYPTITEQDYPQWTLEWMEAAAPRLTPTGSVALVIRSQVRNGCISPYVLRTRLLLYEHGWREPEELMWYKPTAPPVGHKRRPRRSWEHILWFTKNPKTVYCDPKANGHQARRVGMQSHAKQKKQIQLGVFVPYPKKEVPGWARCTDVVSAGTGECHMAEYNTHPAQFPEVLTDWIIKLMCPPGGMVVDPFCGSGTTIISAQRLGRRWAACDIVADYIEIAKRRLQETTSPDVALSRSPLVETTGTDTGSSGSLSASASCWVSAAGPA